MLPCPFSLFQQMRSPLQLVITAVALCHLFPATPLVISQTRPETQSQPADTTDNQLSNKFQISATEGEPLTIHAHEQEKKGEIFTLRGDVEVEYRSYTLRADT